MQYILKVDSKVNLVKSQFEKTGTDEEVHREAVEMDIEIREDREERGLLTELNQNELHAFSEGIEVLKDKNVETWKRTSRVCQKRNELILIDNKENVMCGNKRVLLTEEGTEKGSDPIAKRAKSEQTKQLEKADQVRVVSFEWP